MRDRLVLRVASLTVAVYAEQRADHPTLLAHLQASQRKFKEANPPKKNPSKTIRCKPDCCQDRNRPNITMGNLHLHRQSNPAAIWNMRAVVLRVLAVLLVGLAVLLPLQLQDRFRHSLLSVVNKYLHRNPQPRPGRSRQLGEMSPYHPHRNYPPLR